MTTNPNPELSAQQLIAKFGYNTAEQIVKARRDIERARMIAESNAKNEADSGSDDPLDWNENLPRMGA